MNKIQQSVLDEMKVEKVASEQEVDAIAKAIPSIRNRQLKRLMEIRIEILRKDIECYEKTLETGEYQ